MFMQIHTAIHPLERQRHGGTGLRTSSAMWDGYRLFRTDRLERQGSGCALDKGVHQIQPWVVNWLGAYA